MKKRSYVELLELARRAVVVTPEETEQAWQRFRQRRPAEPRPESTGFVAWLRRTALCRGRAFLQDVFAEPAFAELSFGMDEEPVSVMAEVTREEQDACSRVWTELRGLERPVRFAVILHCLEGRSYRAVGRRLGTSEGQAHRLVSRGLSRLRRRFSAEAMRQDW